MDTTLGDPLVGHVLDGRYRVVSRIARGGMATVYEAVDTRLERTVAVKVMHAGLAADEQAVARFIREAKASARLSHPDVVAVFDQGTDGDAVFLVMEHVEGRTLRSLLRERGRLRPRQALDVLEPVFAALGAAHRAGIVHRDVKPENVLLAADGRVKVADFGLARVPSASGGSGTTGGLIGTVSYLAPEQVERGVADARSDVYSAGVVLFELLTGTKPFTGDSPIQVAYRHVHEDVPPPSSRVPGLAPALDALVARATSRDPDGRPVDATALLAETVATRRALAPDELDHPDQSADGAEPTVVIPTVAAAGGDDTERTRVVDDVPRHGRHGRRRSRRGPALLVSLLLVAVLAGGTGWWFTTGPGATTSTPPLLGLTQEQATERARQAGLGVRVGDPAYSEDVPAGEVMASAPRPGATIDDDGVVTLVLSRGPERIAVPDVVGATREEAVAALTAAGLAEGDVEQRYHDSVPAGSVVSTAPGTGQALRRDTAVSLVVSEGREPVEVADWAGESSDDARAALETGGIVVEVERRYDEQVPRDDVVEQTPGPGTLYRGDTVTLVVSQGPPLVAVPDVVDLRLDEARRTLRAAGFQVRTRGTEILGRVLTQNPGSGHAPRGSVITLGTI